MDGLLSVLIATGTAIVLFIAMKYGIDYVLRKLRPARSGENES